MLTKIEIRLLSAFVFLLLVSKTIVYVIMPTTQQDPIMTISQVFSYLNGYHHSSLFAHAYLDDFIKAPVLSWIGYPYFSVVPVNAFSLYCFHLVFIFINTLLIYLITKNRQLVNPWFYIIAVAYIFSSYTFGMRVESVTITFVFMNILVWYLNIKDAMKLILLALFTALAGLLHPVAGIVAGIFTFINVVNERRFIFFLLYLVAGVVAAFIISGGYLLEYLQFFLGHDEMEGHLFVPSTIIQYSVLSVPLIVLCVILILNSPSKKKVFFLINVFFLLIMCFGRSYYYVYAIGMMLLIVLIFRFNEIQAYQKMMMGAAMIFAFLMTVGLPAYQLIENPAYGEKMRAMQAATRKFSEELPDSIKIWVPGSVGMAVIEKPNSRFHMKIYIYQPNIQKQLDFDQNDVVIIDNYKDRKYIQQLIGIKGYAIHFENYIEPTKGLVTSSSLFRNRSDSIGLWHGIIRKL